MAKVNIPGSGHARFTSAAGNRYWEYDDPKILNVLNQAIFILDHNVKGMKSCNKCFAKLPGGRTFDDVWADNTVWVNYEPRANMGFYGVTHGVGGKDISISKLAFNRGRWYVAGTIVHELAHVNGAPANTAEADETLLNCGLTDMYDGVIGLREQPGSPTSAMA